MKEQMKLFQGDCLEIMSEIPDGSVNMVLTDIPYEVVSRSSNGLRNLDKGKADEGNTLDLQKTLKEINRVCKGSFYVFCSTEQVSEIRSTLAGFGMTTRLGIWEKTNPSPMNGQHIWLSGVECCVYGKKRGATFNQHCQNSVWKFPTARGKLHPTMKPLKLMEYLVESSSDEGQTVLDPFAGSFTTGLACKNLNRKFIGIELDEGYFKIGKERIENA